MAACSALLLKNKKTKSYSNVFYGFKAHDVRKHAEFIYEC